MLVDEIQRRRACSDASVSFLEVTSFTFLFINHASCSLEAQPWTTSSTWPTRPPSAPRSRGSSPSTPTSTPSTSCWSGWRSRCCRTRSGSMSSPLKVGQGGGCCWWSSCADTRPEPRTGWSMCWGSVQCAAEAVQTNQIRSAVRLHTAESWQQVCTDVGACSGCGPIAAVIPGFIIVQFKLLVPLKAAWIRRFIRLYSTAWHRNSLVRVRKPQSWKISRSLVRNVWVCFLKPDRYLFYGTWVQTVWFEYINCLSDGSVMTAEHFTVQQSLFLMISHQWNRKTRRDYSNYKVSQDRI